MSSPPWSPSGVHRLPPLPSQASPPAAGVQVGGAGAGSRHQRIQSVTKTVVKTAEWGPVLDRDWEDGQPAWPRGAGLGLGLGCGMRKSPETGTKVTERNAHRSIVYHCGTSQ